jgi:hypothetical protein
MKTACIQECAPIIVADQVTSVISVTRSPLAPFKIEGCVGAEILKVNLEGHMRSVLCNMEFVYKLSICSRTDKNYGTPR